LKNISLIRSVRSFSPFVQSVRSVRPLVRSFGSFGSLGSLDLFDSFRLFVRKNIFFQVLATSVLDYMLELFFENLTILLYMLFTFHL
jgi:hypothetical protein